MRNIIDILWKREPATEDFGPGEAAEAAFALLDTVPETAEAETGLDSVQRLGQENETFRLLFLNAQSKIDELDKLKSSFDQLSAPLERNLRTIESLKIENSGLRSGLVEARDKISLLRKEVAGFERKLDNLENLSLIHI